MTNKSINLLKNLNRNDKQNAEKILNEIVNIEFKKIKSQAKIFKSNFDGEELHVEKILNSKDGNELFEYFKDLTIYDIALISSYGIDIEFMYLLKVSE